MTLIIVAIIVVAIFLFFSLQGSKEARSNKHHKHLHSLSKTEYSKMQKPQESLQMIRNKTEAIIQRFKKDSLAFFVYQKASSEDLSTAKIEILMQKYGSYSIRPSFIAYLSEDRDLLTSSHLASCITDYLGKHGVQSSESEWESALEQYIWQTTQKEACSIVSQIKQE